MRYGVRILLAPDDNPCKPLLLDCIGPSLEPTIRPNSTGLQRIADVLHQILDSGARLEDTNHHDLPLMTAPLILMHTKHDEAAE